MKIFITGANGFIGKSLASNLHARRIPIRICYRASSVIHKNLSHIDSFTIPGIEFDVDWRQGLLDCDVVVHLAAKVHELGGSNAGNRFINNQYEAINTAATINLAAQAAASGVKRFIFLSTIKVNGEFTSLGKPFSASDCPCPSGPYAISKWKAEVGLREIAKTTAMEVVVIRPTLVYGKGVGANFKKLIDLVRSGIPIPLGAATNNQRSFVSIDNLVDLIEESIFNPAAANQTFLVSDGDDLSTVELLRRIFISLGLRPKIFYMPPLLIKYFCIIIGKKGLFDRLFGSLQVDISATKKILCWSPKYSIESMLTKFRS